MKECKKAFEKAKKFLFEPANAFKKENGTSFGDAFKYFLMLNVVFSVLTGIVIGALSFNAIALIVTIITTYIVSVVGVLVGGVILHIFAYIVGARKGIEQTLKTVLYASTPSLLFGWIIFIGFIFSIWGLILQMIGLKQMHNISTGKAILAVLLPIIIIGIIVIAGALVFLGMFGLSGLSSLGGMGGLGGLSGFIPI